MLVGNFANYCECTSMSELESSSAGLLVYQSLAVAGSGRGGDRAAHDGWVLARPGPATAASAAFNPQAGENCCHLSCVDI